MTRLLVALGLVVCACGAEPPEKSDGRLAMGTVLEITLLGIADPDAETLLEELYAEATRLEGVYSRHDPAAELARLNRAAGGPPAPVPAALFELLRESERWREHSGGAFDVTVGGWVTLWERAAARNRLPTEAERAEVKARVGPGALRLHATRGVRLVAGASVDLGGIAKGATLDVLAERLREAEVPAALLNFGQSSYWARGDPGGSGGWRLALRDARDGIAGTLLLSDRALSVSASRGQFSEIEGNRYGHVIDPRTGEPLLRDALAAVVAPSATAAEAVSTALLVLGVDAGFEWVERLRDCEALWIDAGGVRETGGWSAATRFEAG